MSVSTLESTALSNIADSKCCSTSAPRKRSQKALIQSFERTARSFQSRFKQPYSSCSCDEKFRLANKVSSVLSLPNKGATSFSAVLDVIQSEEGVDSARAKALSNSGAKEYTHPCSHNMVLDPDRRDKGKGRTLPSHRNTLHDPPEAWASIMAKGTVFGYDASVNPRARPPASSEIPSYDTAVGNPEPAPSTRGQEYITS